MLGVERLVHLNDRIDRRLHVAVQAHPLDRRIGLDFQQPEILLLADFVVAEVGRPVPPGRPPVDQADDRRLGDPG
ncbi:MAG: hypothetical protein U0800_17100 [Isosphaeraceae bacterium]